LDTSIPNAYFDIDTPERQRVTQRFWEHLHDYEIYVSDLVVEEIQATTDIQLKQLLLELIRSFTCLAKDTEDISDLTEEYLRRAVFTSVRLNDARHVAIATAYRMDILVSWNQRHLVRAKTRIEVLRANLSLGYGVLDISSPAELL
jgi:predicted nucleic acid-binding protein